MRIADIARRNRVLRPLLVPARKVRARFRSVTRPDGRAHAAVARANLLVRGWLRRAGLSRRRAELREALLTLPAPSPDPRLVSIISTSAESTLATTAIGIDSEVVATPAAARGDLICLVAPSCEPLEPGWLARLSSAVAGDTVAATPLVVRSEHSVLNATPDDLRVAALGHDIVLVDNAPRLQPRSTGSLIATLGAAESVAIGSSSCLLVARDAFITVGGLDSSLEPDAAIVDLCVRLSTRAGAIAAVPSAVVSDNRLVRTRAELGDPFATRPEAWDAVIWRHGPSLYRTVRAPTVPRIAVTTAAPSAKVAARWGDWHFGRDLTHALQRLGYEVRLQTADQADTPASRSCDIQLVLHGLASVARSPGQRHVIWVISHPETLTTEDADAADLLFVASERFAGDLRRRTDTPVEVLLQATDHHRFRPDAVDPRYAHPIVIVAKTRTVMRPIVADALAAGLRPAIYGSGWRQFVDPSLVVADYVANESLPAVYASAGVVLNDHWARMRGAGFVSNRIFDALACGTPVISDSVPEIRDLFGDAVQVYRDADELRALVEVSLDHPEAARERTRAGREEVLRAHTFDHRAQAIGEAIARHRLFTS